MRTAVAILLVLAAQARAQDAGDAPVAVRKGDPVPADGVCLSTERAGRIFLECETAKRNAADFEKALKEAPPPAPVQTVALAVGIGVLIGAAATFVVLKLSPGGK